MENNIRAYHFTSDTLRDGSAIPPVGEWLSVSLPLRICKHGLHASLHPFDALRYAPGEMLHLVEVGGEVLYQEDKLVAEKRMIVASIDATNLVRKFAKQQALSVIHLWDAPKIVLQYLNGDDSVRAAARDAAGGAAKAAAWGAAWGAAWDAAKDAAWAAAGDAAWGATWDAAWAAAGDAAWAAARAAARDAAWGAARGAARGAAGDAAWAAAGDAARASFKKMVIAEFERP